MIASWRGIAVLAAIAVALAAMLVVDLARSHGPPDHRLVHLDVAKVTELAWDGTRVLRTGDSWKQGDITLDGGAIADVLRTLEAATWHRRGGRFEGAHHTLTVAGTTIQLGEELAGTAQTCLVVNGTRVLVDTWVAHALFPEPLALRVRFPFAAAPTAEHIHVRGDKVEVTLVGHPRRLGDHGAFADTAAVKALQAALADVEVVTLGPGGPWKGPFAVELDAVATEVGYACGNSIALDGPFGSTCITTQAWNRVLSAAGAIGVDLHPVLAEPRTIVLPDGTFDAHDANAAALVHALVTPGTLSASDATPLRVLHVDDVELDVLPAGLVRRGGDGIKLRIAHEDWLALQRPASGYADPTRWSEDSSAVVAISIDGKTYQRGAVLGEWTPSAPNLEPLAAALARVQARDGTAAPTTHTLTVTLAPPVGTHATHTVELGAHCAGRIDSKPVAFEPATCQALEAALH